MWILRCANLAHGHNAIFGIDDLNWGMLRGALMDASVGGCAKAQKQRDDGVPSDRWFASRLKGIPLRLIQAAFDERLARQYDIFRKLKRIPKEGLTVAVDMHLISRYDRKPGEELTRSRYKNGTKNFERYMSVHCVNPAMRIVLAGMYLKMSDSVPEAVGHALKTLLDRGVKINLVLLDREFFSVDMMNRLQELGVNFLMPCRNTDNVVAALDEFARRKRGRISENVIENGLGSVPYSMIITERKAKKAKSDEPKEKYIGFATNQPTAKIARYAKRWGIETAYAKIEECRAKTRITCVGARMLCFYYSLTLFNEWIIARAEVSDGTERQSIMTMLAFKTQISYFILQPKPPPD